MKELRILLLEDNPVDVELLIRILKKNSISFSFLCIDNESDFQKALRDFKPDIILSDYNLPLYSGLDALKYVNQNYPFIPLIVVSGAIGEEKAIELLQLGARDYILKDRLVRLPAAIKRIIQEENDAKIRMEYEIQLYQSEELIRNILNSASDAIIGMDSAGLITTWNPEAEKIFGYKTDYAIGKSLSDLIIPPELREAHKNGLNRFLKTGKSHIIGNHIETIAMRSDQTTFSAELTISVIRNKEETFFSAFVRDITERKNSEDALRESEQRYRLLIENSPMCIHEINLQGKIISMNKAGLEMMDLADEDEARKLFYLDSVSEVDKNRIEELLNKSYIGETSHFEFKFNSNRYRILKSCFVPLKNRNGTIEKIMGITEDITQRKIHENVLLESESYFRQLADFDALTKLPNRRLLNDRLGQAMVAGKRSGKYSAVMFLDLDKFKPLNDKYGHNAGDMLLVEVAQRINSCVREIDTVSRFGGDEFIIMLTELDTNKEKAENIASIIADKIRLKLAEPHKFLYKQENLKEITIEYQCTSSIGVVMFYNHENSAEDILKWADIAMYQAKAEGRNRVSFYNEHLQNAS
ncbi:MAG: diguanylate cyclase [Spirochaetia bacterium]|nr:diguanylate cyclase [Spirochaetia bacterium]